ncbi:class E sortase [uncultured Agrococcus sp.]|uniref:class E sortase n=1 Tax=uncultured Agrococcus sp. TaxID=382258 RepID=UPI0025CC11D4|nr:class E sortase [uncultured Agrococcus sp.]
MLARHRKRRPRSRATLASVFGELLLTAGIIIGGFVGWQYYLSDAIMGAQQQDAASNFAASLGPLDRVAEVELRTDEPPAESKPDMHENYAVMYIPRFGDFQRVVGEGAVPLVIDSLEQGLGHYESSALAGERGNFAIAGHRNGLGGPFTELNRLQVGDRIYIQTDEAWYVYEYRNASYVEPTQISVVAPVPDLPDLPAEDRYITLTTCNPEWSAEGRLIAFGVLVGWLPLDDGMPSELAEHLEEIA